MDIQYFSDLHMDEDPWTAPLAGADVIAVVGDLFDNGLLSAEWCVALRKRSGCPVLLVPGNHDFYDADIGSRLRAMQRICKEGDVALLFNRSVVIRDVRFVGATLWADFSADGDVLRPLAISAAGGLLGDFRDIQYGSRRLMPADYIRMHQRALRALDTALANAYAEKVVVLTHYAPAMQAIPEPLRQSMLRGAFATPLEDYITHSFAKCWIYGHIHSSSQFQFGDTAVRSNPRGHGEYKNPNFDPLCVITI